MLAGTQHGWRMVAFSFFIALLAISISYCSFRATPCVQYPWTYHLLSRRSVGCALTEGFVCIFARKKGSGCGFVDVEAIIE
jgi:hypothetical protein